MVEVGVTCFPHADDHGHDRSQAKRYAAPYLTLNRVTGSEEALFDANASPSSEREIIWL